MAKVITFSRTYPSYHPRKGESTYFVEKFLNSTWHIGDMPDFNGPDTVIDRLIYLNPNLDTVVLEDFVNRCTAAVIEKKNHTIRAGHRFKEGDWFSPRVWGDDINPKSGKKGPYHSKQITIAPDIQIKKVWNFELVYDNEVNEFDIRVNGVWKCQLKSVESEYYAENDGLTIQDFQDWFCLSPEFKKQKKFAGQIICWNEEIEY